MSLTARVGVSTWNLRT